jgi:hypothetical protein
MGVGIISGSLIYAYHILKLKRFECGLHEEASYNLERSGDRQKLLFPMQAQVERSLYLWGRWPD